MEKIKINLLIDDQRTNIHTDLIARTATAGKLVLKNLSGLIETLYIDHDLGNFLITGYHIIEYALEEGCLPNEIFIVTMNPVGRKAIQDILLNNGYKQINPSEFRRK